MRESVFTSEIMRTLRASGFFAHKLGDAPITKAVLAVTRFTPGKPFDIVAGIHGRLVGIETKQIRKWKAFGPNDMRPAQVEGLDELVRTKNRAFIFLNIRLEPDYSKGTKRENRLVVFDWEWLRERFQNGSIKAVELKTFAFTLKTPSKPKKPGVFDLSLFLEKLDEPCLSDF